jgi:hypothetical protein
MLWFIVDDLVVGGITNQRKNNNGISSSVSQV